MGSCLLAYGSGCAFDSTSTAAWVQAIGSIIAIVAVGLVYYGEARQRRQEAIDKRNSVLTAVVETIGMAVDHLESVAELSGKGTALGNYSPVTFDRLRMADESLANIPVLELADGMLLHAILTMRSRLQQAERRCGEFNAILKDGGPDADSRLADIHRQLHRLVEIASEAHKSMYNWYPEEMAHVPYGWGSTKNH